MVIHDGQLIYERYAGATTASTPHLSWSISKSLLATVMGVAFGQGLFQLSDPVARYYPAFGAHPQVRVEDLLHWASGLDWQEEYEYAPLHSSVVAMLYTRGQGDMAAFTTAHATYSAPGQSFRYSSGDSNIHSAVWETDASGTYVASSYAYMSARDLARVGLLMLRDGRWQQRQLLPANWVAFNRTPFIHATLEPGEAMPGGHWWLNKPPTAAPRPWPDAPSETFAALGHWGQALYILPEEKLVVVRYADDRDGSFSHNELLKHAMAAFAGGRP
ncbi:Beta-lactamase [compost metagenome]